MQFTLLLDTSVNAIYTSVRQLYVVPQFLYVLVILATGQVNIFINKYFFSLGNFEQIEELHHRRETPCTDIPIFWVKLKAVDRW